MTARTLLIFALAETTGIGAAVAAGLRTWTVQPAPHTTPAILATISTGIVAKLLATPVFAGGLDRLVD
ncbi:hypothetical protein [Nocardia nepalensis]|uniref:hypothetical protein n=1 Tax=Nocardia nepalensis TaxID=3375448 RepID=UPI003B67ACFE